jgi:hypothetical protein
MNLHVFQFVQQNNMIIESYFVEGFGKSNKQIRIQTSAMFSAFNEPNCKRSILSETESRSHL